MKLFRALSPVIGAAALLACSQAAAAATLEVFKSPYCGCCSKWVEHVRAAGFTVNVTEVEDMANFGSQLGVPEKLRSCHTARAGKYLVEGHVPAADIKRLLKEKPDALGIAVPGMPAGSPGMEQSGAKQAYQTILFSSKGERVFAAH